MRSRLKEKIKEKEMVPNLYQVREKLLKDTYPSPELMEKNGTVIGIPMVLSFWDSLPFWRTFFTSLGFEGVSL